MFHRVLSLIFIFIFVIQINSISFSNTSVSNKISLETIFSNSNINHRDFLLEAYIKNLRMNNENMLYLLKKLSIENSQYSLIVFNKILNNKFNYKINFNFHDSQFNEKTAIFNQIFFMLFSKNLIHSEEDIHSLIEIFNNYFISDSSFQSGFIKFINNLPSNYNLNWTYFFKSLSLYKDDSLFFVENINSLLLKKYNLNDILFMSFDYDEEDLKLPNIFNVVFNMAKHSDKNIVNISQYLFGFFSYVRLRNAEIIFNKILELDIFDTQYMFIFNLLDSLESNLIDSKVFVSLFTDQYNVLSKSMSDLSSAGYNNNQIWEIITDICVSSGNNSIFFLKNILPKILQKNDFKNILNVVKNIEIQDIDISQMEDFKFKVLKSTNEELIEIKELNSSEIANLLILDKLKMSFKKFKGNFNSRLIDRILKHAYFNKLPFYYKESLLVAAALCDIGKEKYQDQYAHKSYLKAKEILINNNLYNDKINVILPLILFHQNYLGIDIEINKELYQSKNFENNSKDINENLIVFLRDNNIYLSYIILIESFKSKKSEDFIKELKEDYNDTQNREVSSSQNIDVDKFSNVINVWFPQTNIYRSNIVYDIFDEYFLEEHGIIDPIELSLLIHAKSKDNNDDLSVFDSSSLNYLGYNSFHSLLSASYWTRLVFETFFGYDQGLILKVKNTNILESKNGNMASGCKKDYSKLADVFWIGNDYIYNFTSYLSKIYGMALAFNDVDDIVTQLQKYNDLNDIPDDIEFNVANLTISGKEMKDFVIKFIYSNYINPINNDEQRKQNLLNKHNLEYKEKDDLLKEELSTINYYYNIFLMSYGYNALHYWQYNTNVNNIYNKINKNYEEWKVKRPYTHNEFLVISPETVGVFVKNSFFNLSQNLKSLAEKSNLPVIVINDERVSLYKLIFGNNFLLKVIHFLRHNFSDIISIKSLIKMKISA